MKVIVIFGPPGVGKGTQCSLLAKRLGLIHISTGGIIRNEISSGSELGEKVKDIVKSGNLIDDSLLFKCLDSELKRQEYKDDTVLLLDGVPRNVAQVNGLEILLKSYNTSVLKVIMLVADLNLLITRFALRWTCKCGFVTAFSSEKEALESKCSNCNSNGLFFRREDDKPEVVTARMKIYMDETYPVVEQYKNKSIVSEIDGLGDIEDVFKKISQELSFISNRA